MQAAIRTMAFNGIDTIPVDVQVHLSNGMPGFAIVGLADKAVAESKERVRAALVSHLRGEQVLAPPRQAPLPETQLLPDMADLVGQYTAWRVIEITAAGGHNLLMMGPPGAGKSMLAARLPGLLPPITAAEALEVTMIHSIAGQLQDDGLIWHRPFRDPHHSSSVPALVGGGVRARPGEVSLAHGGILFLDELAEWQRPHLDALRQTIETRKAVVSRANHHITYPAKFQLIAAMNPCRCGYLGDPAPLAPVSRYAANNIWRRFQARCWIALI